MKTDAQGGDIVPSKTTRRTPCRRLDSADAYATLPKHPQPLRSIIPEKFNEFGLQHAVTPEWWRTGIPLGGRRLFMVAWEVTLDTNRALSWQNNDEYAPAHDPEGKFKYRGRFATSCDFLGIDESGRFYVCEGKTQVSNESGAWEVLCQVSELAARLAEMWDPRGVSYVYDACRQGCYLRIDPDSSRQGLVIDHAIRFGLSQQISLDSANLPNITRVVIAPGSTWTGWSAVREEFLASSLAEQQRRLARSAAPKGGVLRGFLERQRWPDGLGREVLAASW